jgi:hypothetical protein
MVSLKGKVHLCKAKSVHASYEQPVSGLILMEIPIWMWRTPENMPVVLHCAENRLYMSIVQYMLSIM